MKYIATGFTNERDVIKSYGFNPDNTIIKHVEHDGVTGQIEYLFCTTEEHENAVPVDGYSIPMRFKKDEE